MSIRAKFLAVLALILTVGVGTTGTVLILQHARHDQALLAEKQLLLVEHAAFALQGNLSVAARELSRLSKLPEIDAADNDVDPERLLLYSAHENSVFFKEVRILSPDGKVTLVQPPGAGPTGESYADRHWFESARKTYQPFFYTAPERAAVPQAIAVVVPVRHDGRFGGAIQGLLDLHDDKVLTPELRHTAGPEGEFVVADREGRVIFPPGEHELARRGWGKALHELEQGKPGSRHIDDGAGDFMYAWAPVGIGNWGVAMRWQWSMLRAGTQKQIESTVAILIVGMLLVGLVAVGFAAYLARPLVDLSHVAARLARGEHALGSLGEEAYSRRGDEVGALWSAFHHMETELAQRDQKIREDLDTISRLNASLEERVALRTRELEEAQAQLLEVERFAAMGKTAAAIAHELRNALNGLGMCVDLVLADGSGSAAGSMRVRAQIHHEIARLRDVTESLLTFSRAPRLERAPVDVHQLLTRALEVLAEQVADGGVAVGLELTPPLDGGEGGAGTPLVISADAYKLQGVFINLIKNAVEAMTTRPLDLNQPGVSPEPRDPASAATAPAGGEPAPPERKLTLRTRRLDGDGGGRVAIEVADTGPGLLPAAREHLFEPFYTTKVTGTGLGLATAKRIVEAHGGRIELDGAAGEGAGAIVRVVLPVAAEPIAAPARAAS